MMNRRKKYFIFNIIPATIIMAAFIGFGIDYFIIINKKVSLIAFISGYLLLFYIGLRIVIRYKRMNLFSIVRNILTPLATYMFTWFSIEFTPKYLLNIVGIFILAAAVDFFWVESASRNRLRNFKKYVGAELLPMISIALIISGGISAYTQIEIQSAAKMSEEYLEWDDYRVEDSLTYNIEEASKITKWKELDEKQKKNLLELYIKIESRYWGMKDFPQLEFKMLSEDTAGEYGRKEDTIYIDRSLLEEEDGYEVLFVLFHEVYHRQEHTLAELYEKLRNDKAYKEYYENTIFYDSRIYAQELHNYVSPEVNFEQYKNQQTEVDSNYYAMKGVLEVQERLEEYFSKSNE